MTPPNRHRKGTSVKKTLIVLVLVLSVLSFAAPAAEANVVSDAASTAWNASGDAIHWTGESLLAACDHFKSCEWMRDKAMSVLTHVADWMNAHPLLSDVVTMAVLWLTTAVLAGDPVPGDEAVSGAAAAGTTARTSQGFVAAVKTYCFKTIVCGKWATVPVTIAEDGRKTVDLSSFAKRTVKIVLTGDRGQDRALANAAAGFKSTPKGYVWHHSSVCGVMELVKAEIHQSVAHIGGFSQCKAA